jgi:hypothetical protein
MKARGLLAVVTFLAASVPAFALGELPTLAVEIKRLDALEQDLSVLAGAAGKPFQREQVLQPWLGALGLSDLSWIDGSRPMTFVLPRAAADSGAWTSWVVAVPAVDPAVPIEALAAAARDHTQEDAVHEFARDGQPTLLVRVHGGYLVSGTDRDAVLALDPQAAPVGVGSYEGNFAFEADLEVLGPIASLGLAAQQQAVRQQLESAGDDEGSGKPSPETIGKSFDLYGGALTAMISNSSRVQLSFELRSQHAIVHIGWKARPGSTFAALLAEQPSEFPGIARVVGGDTAMVSYVSNIRYTPEFLEGLTGFMRGYFSLAQEFLETAGPAAPLTEQWLALQSGMAERRLACSRGDGAGTLDLAPDGGFQVTQVAGLRRGCDSMIQQETQAISELVASGAAPMLTVLPAAIVHQGVTALRLEMDSAALLGALGEQERAEAETFLEGFFGGNVVSTLVGQSRDVLVTTAGSGAEERFKGTVDRLAGARAKDGIRPEMFSPLAAKAGFWLVADLGRLSTALETITAEPKEEPATALEGRVVLGATAERDRLHLAIALPLALIENLAAAGEPAVEPAPEAAPGE